MFLPAGAKPLATYKGGSISHDDLGAATRLKLYQQEKRLYEQRHSEIDKLLRERLLALEAKKQGKTKKQLVDAYIAREVKTVSDAEAKAFFDKNERRLDASYNDLKKQIKVYLFENRKKSALLRYTDRLKISYNARVRLNRPKAPDIKLDIAGEPTLGNNRARVTIVEFSDYECPYCQKIQKSIRRLRREYGDKVRWVFKDFPLPFHKKARRAHVAANCAANQQRYFDYQAKLFDASPAIEESRLFRMATDLRLDMVSFRRCMRDEDGSLSTEIDKDIEYGQSLGVNGTPMLFINTRPVSGYVSYDDLKRIIDDTLKSRDK